MSYASMIGQATGMVTGSLGALMKGKSQSDLMEYEAKVQDNNAYEARAAAKYNADKISLYANRAIGKAGASYGASGVTADSGSVMAVLGASAANAELDYQNTLHGGEVRAINYENQSRLDRIGGKNALSASYFNAFSSLLGGGSQLAYDYGPQGGSGGGMKQQGIGTATSAPLDGGEMGWYPDSEDPEGQPGFFGRGPRGSYGNA